jgi:hypothetical protein
MMTPQAHVAAANVALALANHYAQLTKFGANRIADVRGCGGVAVRQLRAALEGSRR